MGVEAYIFFFIGGIVCGIFIGLKFRNKDLDVKTCIDYLTEQGFWVNLNTKPKG